MYLVKRATGLGAAPAMVVVDMIKGFTDATSPLGHACQAVIEVNQYLLDEFRRREWPIFFTTVVYHKQQQAEVFRHRLPALNVLEAGSQWVELDTAMHRQAQEVLVEKQWASGFFKTNLAAQLNQQGVDSLLVTGLTTSGCVRATAVDGLQHNFSVVVAADAVGDRDQSAHEANLFDLNAKYADVKTSKEIIQQL